jgi:hypothetical protein
LVFAAGIEFHPSSEEQQFHGEKFGRSGSNERLLSRSIQQHKPPDSRELLQIVDDARRIRADRFRQNNEFDHVHPPCGIGQRPAPPSVLPDISPARGEISCGGR